MLFYVVPLFRLLKARRKREQEANVKRKAEAKEELSQKGKEKNKEEAIELPGRPSYTLL